MSINIIKMGKELQKKIENIRFRVPTTLMCYPVKKNDICRADFYLQAINQIILNKNTNVRTFL